MVKNVLNCFLLLLLINNLSAQSTKEIVKAFPSECHSIYRKDSCNLPNQVKSKQLNLRIISKNELEFDEQPTVAKKQIETEHRIYVKNIENDLFFRELFDKGIENWCDQKLTLPCGCLGRFYSESIIAEIYLNRGSEGYKFAKVVTKNESYYIIFRNGFAKQLEDEVNYYKKRFGSISNCGQ